MEEEMDQLEELIRQDRPETTKTDTDTNKDIMEENKQVTEETN